MLQITRARKINGARIAASVVGDDRPWVLRHRFENRDAPKLYATLERIRSAGQIDPAHWYRSDKAI